MGCFWTIYQYFINKDKMMIYFIIFTPIVLGLIFIAIIYYIKKNNQNKSIVLLSKFQNINIIKEHNLSDKSEEFSLKLAQSGTTLRSYNEAKLMIIFMSILIGASIPYFVSIQFALVIILTCIVVAIKSGAIFLHISKSERVSKIDKDLGIFLDLTNVILEAGGGLKNAFFKVSQEAKYIIDDELLKEIGILEYEMTNYSTKKAYDNLKKRVDSRELDKIVDFLLLNEETGIGVKNIFSTQSDEMRQKEFYRIKGKANTLSLYLMLVIFVFILPTLGAFIVFPLMEGKLNLGL